MTIRPLNKEDIDDCVALSTQAGWNQLGNDWRRLLWLWPTQCLGAELNRRIIATGTLTTYESNDGPVGWVGMILVDEPHRGRGVGTAITRAVLDLADRLGVRQLGLDASDQGRPIYASLGFVPTARINRWTGGTVIDEQQYWKPAKPNWRRLADFDHRASGVNREPLLRDIEADTEMLLACVGDENKIRGYGTLRPGRTAWHIGPVVAEDQAAATNILNQLIGDPTEPPRESAIIDVIEGSPMESILRERGFVISRQLTRMSKPASRHPPIAGPNIYAPAGFELG
jgi:GNAT superfamily N-acetyltransferase